MQEALDHVISRVAFAGACGALAGSLSALYKGHQSIPRTAGLTALSCALCGAACFGTERLIYTTTKSYLVAGELDRSKLQRLNLASHAFGGWVGGAWLGTQYLGRPLRGAFFFTPLMMLVAAAEGKFEQARRVKMLELEQLEANKVNRDDTVDVKNEIN